MANHSRRSWFRVAGLMTLCFPAWISSSAEATPPFSTSNPPAPDLPLPSVAELAECNNRFAVAMLNELAKTSKDKNLFFSPFSIHTALLMTAEGARGDTSLQMGETLQLREAWKLEDRTNPWDLTIPREQIRAIMSRLSKSDPYVLSMANAIWVEKTLPLNPEFQKVTRTFYGTQAANPSDFKRQHEKERQRINQWVASQTHDKIQKLLTQGSIEPSTRAVLVNAIYFKGFWVSPFKKKNTTDQTFHLASGQTAKVRLMQQQFEVGVRYGAFEGNGSYFETPQRVPARSGGESAYPGDDGFQVVEIPYNGDGIAMTILLPRTPTGLTNLLSNITSESLTQWHEALQAREVNVLLPRFSMETQLDLKSTLQAMGMSIPFNCSPGVADFSEMTLSGQDNVCIGKAIHQTVVDVNEEGTEAAAATGVIMAPTSAPAFKDFVPEFRADRPFVFLIRDTTSGIVLFVGCMNQPK